MHIRRRIAFFLKMSSEIIDWLNSFLTMEDVTKIVTTIIILAVAVIVDRVVRRAITRYSKRISLDTHIENSFNYFLG